MPESAKTWFPILPNLCKAQRLKLSAFIEQHVSSNDTQTLRHLTVHLKGVRLEELLIAVGVTGVVSHVGGRHFGYVQRTVISKVLAERMKKINKRGRWTMEKEKVRLLITQKKVQKVLKVNNVSLAMQ